MAGQNLYEELKTELTKFEAFLAPKVADIQAAVRALNALGVPAKKLVGDLRALLATLKQKITDLHVDAIPHLADVSSFTSGVTALLTAAKNLLPDAAGQIDSVLSNASVVTGLPSFDQVKADILTLIGKIDGYLATIAS
jgi:ABC-type transporter Mla subunit MlaD